MARERRLPGWMLAVKVRTEVPMPLRISQAALRCDGRFRFHYDRCMSKTQSSMVELGTEAPAFELIDVVSGRAIGRDDVVALAWDDDAPDQVNKMTGGGTSKQGRHGLLVMFICVHCPYVKHEIGRAHV